MNIERAFNLYKLYKMYFTTILVGKQQHYCIIFLNSLGKKLFLKKITFTLEKTPFYIYENLLSNSNFSFVIGLIKINFFA